MDLKKIRVKKPSRVKPRRWTILLIGGLFGIASFFILPSFLKFFGFIIPVIAFSIATRPSNQRFNIHIFLILLFLFVLFASNVVTFDASKPVDIEKTINYVENGANVLTILIGFGIPIVLIVSGIWAIIIGKAVEGVKALFIALMVIGTTLAIAFLFEMAGFNNTYLSWMFDFYKELISFFFELPIGLYEFVDQGMLGTGIGLDLPDIPENKHFRQPKEPIQQVFTTGNPVMDSILNGLGGNLGNLVGGGGGGGGGGGVDTGNDVIDIVIDTFSRGGFDANTSMSYKTTIYALHDCLPLIIGLICLVSVPFFKSKKSEKILIEFFDKFSGAEEKPKKKERRHLPHADYLLIGYGIFLLFSAFFIFLAYTNAYGTDTRQDWKYIMFIYYALMCFISISLLQRFHNYTRSNVVNTFKGSIYGLMGLFLITRLFFSQNVTRAFSTIDMHGNGMYALNTFIFIAPAETLAFSLLIPCFVLAVLQHYANPISTEYVQEEVYAIPRRIKDLEEKIDIKQDDIDLWSSLDNALIKDKKNKTRKLNTQKKVSELIAETNRFKKKVRALKKLELQAYTGPESIIGRPVYLFVFIALGVIGGSFIFATAHWVIISSEIDYAMFWLCGLAIVYFAGGVWFVYVGFKWGWLSAIITHSVYNTSTILMVIFFTV